LLPLFFITNYVYTGVLMHTENRFVVNNKLDLNKNSYVIVI